MKHQFVNWFPFYNGFYLKRFTRPPTYHCYAWSLHLGYVEIRKWVAERPKAIQWISMKDKWPEIHSRVLIYSDPSELFAGRFHVARFEPFEYKKGHPLPEFSFPGFGGVTASHWMPLPEPPK